MKKMFVYGTLRVGMYNYNTYYKAHNTYRQNGYVKGELHTIQGKDYPALIPGNQMIRGEIHFAPDEVQNQVDQMEHFYGPDHPDNEYNKIVSAIYDEHGAVVDYLPVYFYNLNKEENKQLLGDVITCNDYVEYYTKQSPCN